MARLVRYVPVWIKVRNPEADRWSGEALDILKTLPNQLNALNLFNSGAYGLLI